jgi:hypothetical protein
MTPPRLQLVCLCNNQEILESNLVRSADVASGRLPLHLEWSAPSAAIGLNAGIDATSAEILVFVHQDVFLPQGWADLLERRIAEVAAVDPDWALIGAFGVDLASTGWGPVWSTSLGAIVGQISPCPVAVQSFDELLIVMRRGAGLRFDPGLPGFHLYGTDIVQSAAAKGLGAWAVPLPLIHNDGFHEALDASFDAAYHYMRQKWHARLPLKAPVVRISWHGLNLLRQHWHNRRTAQLRKGLALARQTDPRTFAGLCGWSDLAPPDA